MRREVDDNDKRSQGQEKGSRGQSVTRHSGDATPARGRAHDDRRRGDNRAETTRDDHPGPDTPRVNRPYSKQSCDY